jgi:hypothetical protein
MSKNKFTKEEELALKEYDFGEKLRSDYFKHCWVATSILLPVCFTLVALSYTDGLLNLRWYELLPLALASIFLYIIWFWYDWRYSGYMKIIYQRLRELEKDHLSQMNLYSKIDAEDPAKCCKWKSLGTLKRLIFILLVLVWGLRMCLIFSS